MNKYYINYAHNGYYQSQKNALQIARSYGFLSYGYGYQDLSNEFKEENKELLKYSKGAGYWIWKPYIISHTLSLINDGDYLVYIDSGAYLTKSVDDILRCINYKGVLGIALSIQKQSGWTKGDVFEVINGKNNIDNFKDERQIMGGLIFLRKNKFCVNFINEWLYYCKNERFITDLPSIYPNFSDFKEHRHDQSIWSLLCYNNDVMYLPDISQYRTEFSMSDEWERVNCHRNRN